VTANDISQAQMQLAKTRAGLRDNVAFVQGDMTKLVFAPGELDAVVGLYSIIHLPREEQRAFFGVIHAWLRPGGLLLCNLGTGDQEASVAEWLGAKMYWSQFDAATNVEGIRKAGFTILQDEIIEEEEHGSSVPFQWILAQKDRES
jgi:SAM-dependent methyltransferase